MQKVLRRALLARNQTLRAKRAAARKEAKEEEREFFRSRVMRDKALRGYVKAERTARREDWILGPLAPQRDIGDQKGVYGTMSPMAIRSLPLPERRQEKYVNFTVGDRVVAVRGRDRGKIAYINTIDTKAMTADQHLPDYARGKGAQRTTPYQTIELPTPIADIRLVVSTVSEKTKMTSDVVVRHLRGGEPIIEREHGVSTPRHTRYVEGLDMEVPWPEARKPDYKAEDCDTLRMSVEDVTEITSVNEPFPPSVMDELRNPFNRERSRHEQEFIEKKLKEGAFESWKKSRRLLTPRAEYLEVEAKKRREALPMKVTDDLLQLIRQEQSRTLDRGQPVVGAS